MGKALIVAGFAVFLYAGYHAMLCASCSGNLARSMH